MTNLVNGTMDRKKKKSSEGNIYGLIVNGGDTLDGAKRRKSSGSLSVYSLSGVTMTG